jgi:hypothetical protein
MAHFADFMGVIFPGARVGFSGHSFHRVAATTTQGLGHGNAYERLSGDFYFA